MARYQIKDAQGRKINVIEWDGESDFGLPTDHTVEPDDGSPFLISTPIVERSALSDWRVALVHMGRLDEVLALVKAAKDSGSIEGRIAWERVEYANHVHRSELMQLAPIFGFSPDEVDESLILAGED